MTVTTPRGADERARGGPAQFVPRFPLVEAKLVPPAVRPGFVRRSGLLEMAGDRDAHLIAIVAPPGFGKSTLLSQWVARDRRSVAWLTLDAHDNDPAVFLTYLAAALDRVRPLGTASRAAVPPGGPQVLSATVTGIAATLHRWDRPVLIVLDDAHLLVDRACLDALTELIDHLPALVQVAIAARTEPGLPLARLRAARVLREIGPADLAFDRSETAELVADAGHGLSDDDVGRLHARTEGWPAVTYLAVLALRRDSPAAAVDGVSGRDRFIADYLRSELLGRLDDDDITFLTRTAILDYVDGELADAVSGLPGSGERLRALARENLLIVPIGPAGEAHRYHTLFREFLAAELERREPGTAPGLHRRAAAWYARHGRADLAIEHRFDAGDVEGAARLFVPAALPLFYAGHAGTLDRWLSHFDDALFERHPPLAVLGAWINLLSGRPARADRLADIAEHATFDGPPGDGSASFESSRAILRAIMCRRGPDDALANARLAVEREPAGSPWRTAALIMYGSAWLLMADAEQADAAFAEAVSAGGLTGANTMLALANRTLLALRRGDWQMADEFASDARRALETGDFDGVVSALMVYAVAARVAIHHGDRARAEEELARAQLLRPLASHAAPWFAVQSLVELGRAYLALADPSGARRVLRDAEAIMRVRPALGALAIEIEDLRRRLRDEEMTISGASALTTAELRLVPLLPTYLSFQDIADRLFLSRNTVKTQALSIYGKLGASSRGEAVERAVAAGLLQPYPGLEPRQVRAPD